MKKFIEVEGSVVATAAAMNISARTVKRAVYTRMREQVEAACERIGLELDVSLMAIKDGLQADKDLISMGLIVKTVPDHMVRLRAAATHINLLVDAAKVDARAQEEEDAPLRAQIQIEKAVFMQMTPDEQNRVLARRFSQALEGPEGRGE